MHATVRQWQERQRHVNHFLQALFQLLEALPQQLVSTEALSAMASGAGLEQLALCAGSPSDIVILLIAEVLQNLEAAQVRLRLRQAATNHNSA